MTRYTAVLVLFSAYLLTSCTTLPSSNCVDQAKGISPLKPCWLVHKPNDGMILTGHRNSWGTDGWLKAQQTLLKQATALFAQQRISSEVTTTTVVHSNTQVANGNAANGGKEQVHRRVEVQETTEISQADESITVNVTLKDYYYYPPTDAVHIWVIDTQ